MLDDIGPGSFSQRIDHPDLTAEGDFKIVPMRIEKSFKILASDTDPRGLEVFGLEGKVGELVSTCGSTDRNILFVILKLKLYLVTPFWLRLISQ